MSWERGDGGVGEGVRWSGLLPSSAIFKQKPEGRDIGGTRWLFLQLRRQSSLPQASRQPRELQFSRSAPRHHPQESL